MIERYTRPEIGAVWSDERKLATWLEVELAVVDALAELGEVPRTDAEAIRARASFTVEAARHRARARERDPDHRQVGVGGHYARERGRQPRARDDHPDPAHARVLRVVGDHVRVAMGAHHARLVADPPLVELLARLLHRRHVALRAHDDADARSVDLELLELGDYLGLDLGRSRSRSRLGHARTPSAALAAMSRRT